jgi:hypothetical protein
LLQATAFGFAQIALCVTSATRETLGAIRPNSKEKKTMQRIIHFWKSGIMGKLVIGCGGLIGLLFICVICGVLFGQGPSRKILELDERLKPFSNKTLNLQNVSEIKLDQIIQVGEYLVKVTSLERTTQYLTYFGKKKLS